MPARNFVSRYIHWLHTRWPAGAVEKLPECAPDGTTALPGVRIVGDLAGVPLLKFALDSGAKAVAAIAAEPGFRPSANPDDPLDIAIVGAGVSGIAAAVEARRRGLRCAVFEATRPFSTIANFPAGKPIFTLPEGMTPEGRLQVSASVKEPLLEELERQRHDADVEPVHARIERLERIGRDLLLHHAGGKTTRAQRVIVAIGRSGNFRRLGVPGEDLGKVSNRLHDPKDYQGADVLVVGGGDTALETAIALAACGARVTLSYRGKEFSRPKPGNLEMLRRLERDPGAEVAIEQPSSERVTTAASSAMRGSHTPGSVTVMLQSRVQTILPKEAVLTGPDGTTRTLPNDAVFVMIGREAPLEFFRRSGIPVRGEWRPATWFAFVSFLAFTAFLCLWKGFDPLKAWFKQAGLFPYNVPDWFAAFGAAAQNPAHILGTLHISAAGQGFWYSLAYCAVVAVFGIDRMIRRPTPYIRAQTLALMAIQIVPLFLLPFLVLPWMGHNGAFDAGLGRWFADTFLPAANYGHGREYWRAFGFILAWPLFLSNVFTAQPLWGWLALSLVQTFVLLPLAIRRWGKGVYCGWICSCGALAETLGDRHRQKMPHGPSWNRLNMIGQGLLLLCFLLLAMRAFAWAVPGTFVDALFTGLYSGWGVGGWKIFNYQFLVELIVSGVLGIGLYFWFSGRTWCRFACPLAALMHIYARFSKFRIFPDKKRCISCNVCTSVCHQGIDVMNFANKGLAMEDPQCVRCSACVQSCPTGVLAFGHIGPTGNPVLDRLQASLVRAATTTPRPARAVS